METMSILDELTAYKAAFVPAIEYVMGSAGFETGQKSDTENTEKKFAS